MPVIIIFFVELFDYVVEIASCIKDQQPTRRNWYMLTTLWLLETSLCLTSLTFFCGATV